MRSWRHQHYSYTNDTSLRVVLFNNSPQKAQGWRCCALQSSGIHNRKLNIQGEEEEKFLWKIFTEILKVPTLMLKDCCRNRVSDSQAGSAVLGVFLCTLIVSHRQMVCSLLISMFKFYLFLKAWFRHLHTPPPGNLYLALLKQASPLFHQNKYNEFISSTRPSLRSSWDRIPVRCSFLPSRDLSHGMVYT